MRKFVSIMNHVLTQEQLEQAKIYAGEELEVVEIKGPMVDPAASTEAVQELAAKFIAELPEETAYVNVMSDFGFTVAMAEQLKKTDIIPIYATTNREAKEVTNPDGSITKTSVFKHVQFRRY